MNVQRRFASYAVVVAVVLSLWFALTTFGVTSQLILPRPADVAQSLGQVMQDSTLLRTAVLATLLEVIAAFSIAAVVGVPLGLAVGRIRLLAEAYEPLLGNLSAIPLVLLYPLLVGLFGLGGSSKVALGALYALFPTTIAAIRAGHDVDGVLETAARSMGARGWQLQHVLVLPSMVPGVVAGLRVGLGLATVTVVAGEFISSTKGLGYQLAQTSQELNTPSLFAWIVITLAFTIVLGASMSVLGQLIDRRVRR